jgi:hypothetical protein
VYETNVVYDFEYMLVYETNVVYDVRYIFFSL